MCRVLVQLDGSPVPSYGHSSIGEHSGSKERPSSGRIRLSAHQPCEPWHCPFCSRCVEPFCQCTCYGEASQFCRTAQFMVAACGLALSSCNAIVLN